ncbi:MAG: hypothetical protein AB1938_02980 [Myxococcota bacterium]
MRAVAASLFGLVLLACPGPDRPPPPEDTDGGTDTPAWPAGDFQLGTSSPSDPTAYVAMPSTLQLVPGAQGGFHVPVMYRVTGHSGTNLTFEHKVRRVKDGVLVSRGSRLFDVLPQSGGAWVSEYEITIFMCPTPVGVTVMDEALTFEVRILDESSKLLSVGTAQAVVHCPAGNSFCESICKG